MSLMPILDFPRYSSDLFVDRSRAQVRARNQQRSVEQCELNPAPTLPPNLSFLPQFLPQ